MFEGFSRVYVGSNFSPISNSFSSFIFIWFFFLLFSFVGFPFSQVLFFLIWALFLQFFFFCFFFSFFLSNGFFFKLKFFSSGDEVLYDMDQEATMLFHVGFIVCTSRDLFTTIEMEEGGGDFVDPINGVQDVLTTLWSTLTIQKVTNFIAIKFEDLTSIVVPTIISHVMVYRCYPYCFWETIKVEP